jgi:type VI secretion system VasD/TssJ family lipoprotein
MRPDPVPSRSSRALGACLIALALFSIASCAKVPLVGKTPTVSLTITSTADANSCGKGTGNSLYFRVLQVTDASSVTGLTLAQLWDKEEKVLGPALLSKKEDVIDAGSTRELKLDRAPTAKAIVVVGNFCNTDGACWRVIHPTSAGSRLNLKVDASCLSEAKR